jgi:hypothetical protein
LRGIKDAEPEAKQFLEGVVAETDPGFLQTMREHMIVASHLAPIRASAAVADGGHLASRSECAPRRALIALETRKRLLSDS